MFKKISLLLLIVIIIIGVYAVGTAIAAKVSVVIKPGNLQLTPSADQSLTDVTLDGDDQITSGSLGQLQVKDARGTGTGWHLTVDGTDFEEITDSAKTISSAGFDVTGVNLVTLSGNGGVVGNIGNLASPGFDMLDSASPNGRGKTQATPDLDLDVPAETYVGTYASTVTETLASY